MKKITILTMTALWAMTSCSELKIMNERDIALSNAEKPLSGRQINEIIDGISSSGKEFYWNDLTAHQLWSATQLSDSIISVGFGTKEKFYREILPEADNIEREMLQMIAESEQGKVEDILVEKDEDINRFDVKIKNYASLLALKKYKYTRSLVVVGYNYQKYTGRSSRVANDIFSTPCIMNPVPSNSPTLKYAHLGATGGTAANRDFYMPGRPTRFNIPWNHSLHRIQQAWKSGVYGQGITIGVVDTGASPFQQQCGDWFDDYFPNRTIRRESDFVGEWGVTHSRDDVCGHGTSMLMTAVAGPSIYGLPIGVAPAASGFSVRVGNTVIVADFFGGIRQKNLAHGIRRLANDINVKIISMSLGGLPETLPTDGREYVEEMLQMAVSKGKLVFIAAGTAAPYLGVTWPGRLEKEGIYTVTGIKSPPLSQKGTYDPNLLLTDMKKCDNCHEGKEVDFVVFMEDRKNPTIQVPTNGYRTQEVQVTGGSSVATASMAGMAALVWSKYPKKSAKQIADILAENSATNLSDYGKKIKHPTFGWGVFDVAKFMNKKY